MAPMPPMPPKKELVEETVSAADDGAVTPPSITRVVTDKTPGFSHDEVLSRYKEQVPENRDFTAPRNESLFSLPSAVQNVLKSWCLHPEDYICLELMVNACLTIVPLYWIVWGIPLWAPEGYQWLIHVAAPAMIVLFALPPVSLYQRYILTLHVTSHGRIFSKKYAILNKFNEVFLNPHFGIPPGSYHLHHVVMHHRENNVFPRDMSSTMPYQRDSLSGLLSYCVRYWTHQVLYLGYYAFKTGRVGLGIYYIVCMSTFFLGIAFFYTINPVGTLWMMLFSSGLTGLLLMQGNFAQHMFIDPKRRFSNYGLAFNYVNHECNQKTYNDGYHIIHHMNSLRHWSEVPQWFEDNIELFAINEALIFNAIDTMQAWVYVIAGNWTALHAAWVDLSPGPKRSVEFFKHMIEERLVPLDGEPGDGKYD